MKEFLYKHRYVIMSLALVFIVALFFPYTGDDYDWGMHTISLEEIWNVFRDPLINGRYVGNVFVMVMAKYKVVRSAIIAVTLVGIVKLVKKEIRVPGYLVWLLLLVMPIEIARQSIVWTSGFTNYVISTLFMIGCLLSTRKVYREQKFSGWTFINLILFFLSSFFIENLTIFLLIMNIGLNAIYFIKHKKINGNLMAGLVGSLAGTALMFMQGAYGNVIAGEDSYRTMGGGLGTILYTAVYNYIFFIQKYTIFQNIILVLALTVLMHKYRKVSKKNYSKLQARVLDWTGVVMTAYSSYIVLANLNREWTLFGDATNLVNGLASTIFLFALLVHGWILFFKEKEMGDLVAYIAIIVGLLLPLFAVTPIGPRNFFPIYILEMVAVLKLAKMCKCDFEKTRKWGAMALGMLVVYYGSIYFDIAIANARRDNYISYVSRETELTSITVPTLPNERYVYDSSFKRDYQLKKYKERYDIREDLNFEFIDYEEWLIEIETSGYRLTP